MSIWVIFKKFKEKLPSSKNSYSSLTSNYVHALSIWNKFKKQPPKVFYKKINLRR